MKRLNAFYGLPYWEDLLINHLLDPMHVFKNVGVAIWKHLTGAMDNIKARKDLEVVGVKKVCWIHAKGEIPPAPWILTKVEREHVKKTIGMTHSNRNHAFSKGHVYIRWQRINRSQVP